MRRGFGSRLLRGLALWVLTALAFLALSAIVPGIGVPRFGTALLATATIAILNAILWPLLIRMALPLTILTFGLGSLVLNGIIISLALTIVDGAHPSLLGAIAVAFFLALVQMLLTPVVGIDPDARALRVVRRRARRARKQNRTDVPGVILFEIDGLAEPVLRQALRRAMRRPWRGGSRRAVIACSDGSATSPRRPVPARQAFCSAATTTCRPSAGTRRTAAGRSSPTG